MKIVLLVVGKTDSKLMAQATEEYIRRLSHYVSFEVEVIPDVDDGPGRAERRDEHPGQNQVHGDEDESVRETMVLLKVDLM